MPVRTRLKTIRSNGAGLFGLVLVFLAGFALLTLNSSLGLFLRFASYDCIGQLSELKPMQEPSGIIIIFMDEISHKEFDQPLNQPWSRALHAKLLDRLTSDHAGAVVFDIIFSDPGPDSEADADFARAICNNGHVLLAADLTDNVSTRDQQISVHERTATLPYAPFLKAAAGCGFSQLQTDEDFLIREHKHAMPDTPYASLAWATAEKLELKSFHNLSDRRTERWMNYYGRPGVIDRISYKMALDAPKGFFQNKIVFVGGRPTTGLLGDRKDEFRSPYAPRFREPTFMPAVEVHAITLLNLIWGDWLRRLPPAVEYLILIAGALFFGYGLSRHSPGAATVVAFLGVVVFSLMTALLFFWTRLWFPWLIVAAAQAPTGLLSAISFRSVEWYRQKRRYESDIREQAALLDKARDAIMVYDLKGCTTYWNPSAERLYGWTLTEMHRRTASELLFTTNPARFLEAFQATLSDGEWYGELEQTIKTGQKITVESRWSRICDEKGATKGILVINTNITERRKLEIQLWQAQRVKSIGALATGITHDLNNLLTPILMSSQILQPAEENEKRKKLLKTIELSAQRGAGMAKQILTFVRGCQGEMVILQPKHLIREIVKIINDTFPKKVTVEARLAPDLAQVRGDATQLHQVLLNLCVNARDAMPQGGTIRIEARNVVIETASNRATKPGTYVLFRVSDDGEGISPEIIDHVFDPFFTTKESGKGTGLGLSTVLGIVKGHQGFIEVTSELAKGAVFSVFIPAINTPVSQIAGSEKAEIPTGQNRLVLIVEDESFIRAVIEFVLQQNDYRVIQAENGERALELFAQRSGEIDVVLLDAMMPGMNSQAVMTAMKKMNPDAKLINISGFFEPESTSKSGIETIENLEKPFTAEKLLEALHRVTSSC